MTAPDLAGMRERRAELNKAIIALYLEVPEAVAKDVSLKAQVVMADIAALLAENGRMREALEKILVVYPGWLKAKYGEEFRREFGGVTPEKAVKFIAQQALGGGA